MPATLRPTMVLLPSANPLSDRVTAPDRCARQKGDAGLPQPERWNVDSAFGGSRDHRIRSEQCPNANVKQWRSRCLREVGNVQSIRVAPMELTIRGCLTYNAAC